MSDDDLPDHVVLNLSGEQARDLRSLLDISDGDPLSPSESHTKKTILLDMEKQGLRGENGG